MKGGEAVRLSTKGRYALRLMLDIALQEPELPVSLRDVARRQDISVKYLEQLTPSLVRAKLLRAVRGAGGGYFLVRKPEACTVGEILRAAEGELVPVECAGGGCCCERADTCVTMEVWRDISEAIDAVVDHRTLADLVTRSHEKSP